MALRVFCWVGGAVLALPLLSPMAHRAGAQAIPRPNVLIIVTDDQRGALSVMPLTRRDFERQGRRFSDAHVTTPVCCPSRASIMTGRYAHNHGVKSNSNPDESRSDSLDQQTTLQYYLQQAGYRTGLVGKFLNFWPMTSNPPYFDDWVICDEKEYTNYPCNYHGTVETEAEYTTRFISDNAIQFLKADVQQADPWYLYVAPKAPHLPASPESKYADAPVPHWDGNPAVFEKDKSDKPPYVRRADATFAKGSKTRAKQYRALMSVDDMIHRIFRFLKRKGEAGNTLAFFISDNGYFWSEHGLHGKDAPYKQDVSVPMMMRWPDAVTGGSVDSRMVANIDIAPTVEQAAGVPPDPNVPMDGRSLLDPTWDRKKLLLEYWCNGVNQPCNRWHSLLTPGHQYTEYFDSSRIAFREYYGLRKDPWQLTNLLHDGLRRDNPNVARLHRRLTRLSACKGTIGTPDPCP